MTSSTLNIERKTQLDKLLTKRLAKVGEASIPSRDVRKNILASLSNKKKP